MRKYKIFDKIHSFLKHFSNVLNSKKGDYIFEESLNLHVIVVSFFSLPLWIPKENTAELEKLFNLNSRLRWGAPANALCWSEESAQIKHFTHYALTGMYSLFTWFQPANTAFLLMKTHRVVTLICMGVLGVRFVVGLGRSKITTLPPPVSRTRQNYARNFKLGT